jgi:hypothetical protein
VSGVQVPPPLLAKTHRRLSLRWELFCARIGESGRVTRNCISHPGGVVRRQFAGIHSANMSAARKPRKLGSEPHRSEDGESDRHADADHDTEEDALAGLRVHRTSPFERFTGFFAKRNRKRSVTRQAEFSRLVKKLRTGGQISRRVVGAPPWTKNADWHGSSSSGVGEIQREALGSL